MKRETQLSRTHDRIITSNIKLFISIKVYI